MVLGTLVVGLGLGWLLGRLLVRFRPRGVLQPVRVVLPQRRRHRK